MTSKTKKIIAVLAVLLLASAAGIGYYMYNKGPVDVAGSKAVVIDAVTLYYAYINDSTKSKRDYSGRILEVEGEVTGVSKNAKNQPVLLLKTSTPSASINCTLEDALQPPPALSRKVRVKGICSGLGQGDPDLGIMGDVYLTRCVTVEP